MQKQLSKKSDKIITQGKDVNSREDIYNLISNNYAKGISQEAIRDFAKKYDLYAWNQFKDEKGSENTAPGFWRIF